MKPGRVVEDASVQCIPVSRMRKVDKIVSSENLINAYNPLGGTEPRLVPSGSNTQVTYVVASPGYQARVQSTTNPAILDGSMTFAALPSATSGLIVDVNIYESNHPSVTGLDRNYIGQGTLTVELRNLATGGIGTFLVSTQVVGGGSGRLTVPPGMVAPGNVIKLWMHYDAPPLPGWLSSYPKQARIFYTAIVSNIIKPVDQQYVALSCDTDGAYAATYRYGFNGQQKDEEIAGKDNHNTALFWAYDTRLGRRWNLDPADQVHISNYATFRNNPIFYVDIHGDLAGEFRDEKNKVLGNDGKSDGKQYVLKTDKKSLENEDETPVPCDGISKDDRNAAKKFVEKSSGDKEKFEQNPDIYNKFVEVEGDPVAREQMYRDVTQDDGKGGQAAANNREYGGAKIDG